MKKRIVWIDLLRILATWGVISIHGKIRDSFNPTDPQWVGYILIGVPAIACVPLFLMLSGMLTLKKEVTIEKTIKHNIPRVLGMKILSMAFYFLYAVGMSLLKKDSSYISVDTLRGVGTAYLSILFGCYLVAPFISQIINDDKLEKYFIILAGIFNFIVPIIDLDIFTQKLPNAILYILQWLDFSEVYLPVGAVWFFVLGHYIDKKADMISKRKSAILLVCGLISQLGYTFIYQLMPEKFWWLKILGYGRYYGSYVAPIVTFYSVSIFLFFRVVIKDFTFSDNAGNYINHLGRNCMFIYLLHGVCIWIIQPHITPFWCKSFVLETIVETTMYFIICYIISLALEKMPIIKKLM